MNEFAQQVIRRFGVFELDLKAGELRRHGHKIKLQEQPFQVLSQLLEKPGEVITREELRNRLWPADTFVDFDHSLNAAIRRLRDALGDSADNPTFVETVARRGYRFLAPVSLGAVNGNGDSSRSCCSRSVAGVPPFAALVDSHFPLRCYPGQPQYRYRHLLHASPCRATQNFSPHRQSCGRPRARRCHLPRWALSRLLR